MSARSRDMVSIFVGVLCVALALDAAADVVDQRRPVPPAAQFARSQSRVRDVFADELESATTVQKKADVARRLADQAGSTADSSDRFALLSLALDKAVEAGDVSVGAALIDRIPREYAVDPSSWRLDAATRLAAKAGPAAAADLADVCLTISRQALDAGHDEVASKAVTLAAAVARKAKDPDLVAQATRLQLRMKQRQAVERDLRPLLEALAADPGEASVCGEAGKALCLKADRWAEGLPLLAKGSDESLRRIAAAELKPGDAPEHWAALGDAWWDWSESQKPPWKAAAKARAAFHYERAVASLVGLDRARVEKRLAAAARQSGGSGQTVFLADLPENGVAGQVMFSKDGQCFGKPFTVAGKTYPKSITALPKAKGFSTVAFAIPAGSLRCRGKVAIFTPATAKAGEKPASPLVFQLVVDGDVAWQSPPLQKLDECVGFDVELDGGRVLELRTAVGDSDWCSWGAWLDPVLVR